MTQDCPRSANRLLELTQDCPRSANRLLELTQDRPRSANSLLELTQDFPLRVFRRIEASRLAQDFHSRVLYSNPVRSPISDNNLILHVLASVI